MADVRTSRGADRLGDAVPADRRPSGKVVFIAGDGHIRSLRSIEADVICLAVEQYRGQLAEVSRRLGIGRSTLYRKLEEAEQACASRRRLQRRRTGLV